MKKHIILIIVATSLLLFVGCNPQSTKPVDTEAMKEAEGVYTQYVLQSYATPAEFMLYNANGVFVWLRNGDAVGEYSSKEAALTAMNEDLQNGHYALYLSGEENLYVCKQETQFIHISFDDTAASLLNLNDSKYNSLFEEPFYKWLKNLHDTYDAKFSLYVFADCLSNVTDRFAAEFAAASDWMKFGLHSPDNENNYKTASYEYGKQQWNDFVANILRITGSEKCIDRIPRLHNCAGNEKGLLGMRDANYGALGFLAADDTRASYTMGAKLSADLFKADHLTDRKNGFIFLTSKRRLEDNAKYPNGAYSVLNNLFNDETKSVSSYILFTHETNIYDAATGTFKGRQTRVEEACRFAFENKIPFAYPQEVEFSITDLDINP